MLSYTAIAMPADALVTFVARTSAGMILIKIEDMLFLSPK